MMIDTVPLPEGGGNAATPEPGSAMIQFEAQIGFRGSNTQHRRITSALMKLVKDGLMIGTWPQPEGPLGRHLVSSAAAPTKRKR